MKLSEKRRLFTVMIANLIHFAEEKGHRLTFRRSVPHAGTGRA